MLLELAADLLYPLKCPFCGRVLDDGEQGICPKCREGLPRTASREVKVVGGCDACLAPLWYLDGVPDGVIRYKFRGGRNHSLLFASLMTVCVEERLPDGVDLVTWAPLSKKRLRRRGYDQARLLAEGVAERLGVPAVPLLEKVRNTRPQSRLIGMKRRRANVARAYRLLEEGAAQCAGRRVLLVDDVITTGSTMGECAQLLKKAGAVLVVGMGLAWARK